MFGLFDMSSKSTSSSTTTQTEQNTIDSYNRNYQSSLQSQAGQSVSGDVTGTLFESYAMEGTDFGIGRTESEVFSALKGDDNIISQGRSFGMAGDYSNVATAETLGSFINAREGSIVDSTIVNKGGGDLALKGGSSTSEKINWLWFALAAIGFLIFKFYKG